MKTRLLCALLLAATWSHAQQLHDARSLWLFPGVNWKYSAKNSVLAQAGYNPLAHMDLLWVQAFLKVHPNITLNPGYLYLGWVTPGPVFHEHTLTNGVIFSTPIRKWYVEDRNLLWDRFRSTGEHTNFYRNRLRVYLPPVSEHFPLKPYVFDEAFYFIDRGLWSRNRAAVGALYAAKHYSIDVFYAREHDHYKGDTNMLFVMVNWIIRRHSSTAPPEKKLSNND